MLYIVDWFAVSYDAYHDLSVASNLPPLQRLKQACAALNSSLTLNRFEGTYPRAFRPFLESLKNETSKEARIPSSYCFDVQLFSQKSRAFTTNTSGVSIRVSGDGAHF